MKMMNNQKTEGFTLVEVIIAIVVVAIVGAMIVSTLGTSMTKSAEPIVRMQTAYSLQQVMENFIAANEKYYAGDLPGLRNAISGGVLIPAGNEGATLDNVYGKYTIVENHFIKFVSNGEQPAGDTEIHNLLKVTIKNSNNETLTYIFTG
ncbi:MAG: type II secretion system protein [Smithella sp.]